MLKVKGTELSQNYNKIAKKILTLGISFSFMLSSVPKVNVFAADGNKIPDEMFISKSDLLTLCESTNSGTGLLATGESDKDKVLQINFGKRAKDVKFKNWDTDSTQTTAKGEAITWLVAGKECSCTVRKQATENKR